MTDTEETEKDEDLGGPFTPQERKQIREMLGNYRHSRWLFALTGKLAKWLAVIVGGIMAYKQLPGLLK